jgi:hypothetical protein
MKKTIGKLMLSKETLASLDGQPLQEIRGGISLAQSDCSVCAGCTTGATASNCPRLCY